MIAAWNLVDPDQKGTARSVELEIRGVPPASHVRVTRAGTRANQNYLPASYRVRVTLERERGVSGSRPLASASKAAKSWPGMM